MIIETLSTGDEVIAGFITDTNVSWLCQRLLAVGVQVNRRQTVGDRFDDIVAVIDERSRAADVLIVNGGLGPTTDDNTTAAAAWVAGVKLEKNQMWADRIEAYAQSRGFVMDPSNLKQAMLPAGSELLNNPIGTACGFKMRINKALCYFTPGVPSEFKHMMDTIILPELQQILKTPRTVVRSFFTMGVSESNLGGILSKMQWPSNIVLGYRANFPTIEVKIIATDPDEETLEQAEEQLLSVIEPHLIAKGELNIPAQISKLTGVIPLQVLEDGTDGMVIALLAQEMHGLTGHFIQLPTEPDDLIARLKREKIRTLAISAETQEGFCIAYFNGRTGYLQRLKSRAVKEKDRKKIIAMAALDMTRRVLSGKSPFGAYENLIRTEQLTFRQ
ncbi:MAG: hypothetical protein IJ523_08345 [Succinivibrionaceae bacterium]|nr:hypothetical protein [Succinivibrionaceae bacterium]